MSFRFQKRVRIAPGVRINFSKRGVSTSVGPQGASLTAGKRGLYGNTGIPGTGLSYRTKLNKKGDRSTNRSTPTNKDMQQNVEVIWDDSLQDVRFEKNGGHALTEHEEKQVRKHYKNDLSNIYREKASEINSKTDRLLVLHHHLFKPSTSLAKAAEDIQQVAIEKPDKERIYLRLQQNYKANLSLLEKLKLWLPKNRKNFNQTVESKSNEQFNEENVLYNEEIQALLEETEYRKQLALQVKDGNTDAMEKWISLFLEELDFPLETDLDFKFQSETNLYVDLDLPKPEEVPITKATLLKSGRLKIVNKTQRDHREHYALMVGGSALYLASFFFCYLPTLQSVTLSGYNQVVNRSTGHEEDQYIYSVMIDRETLYSLNMKNVHPIEAFHHFQPNINVTKTYIFKEIIPYH